MTTRQRISLTVGLTVLLVGPMAGRGMAAELTESRTIEESYQLRSGGRLIVDNIFGSIHVRGSSTDRVVLRVEETIEAKDAEALERARQEVELLVEQRDAELELYVDGPFRERDGWGRRHRRYRPRYQVTYDFVIEVPRGTEIELATVTEGEIEVTGVHGDFDVSNVNGGIELSDLQGSGRVETVNGPIHADFGRSPLAASEFKTVNGDVEVVFSG